MKTFFYPKKLKYDGSQLRPLFAYENFNVQGPAIVSWVGACDVGFDHMVDFEDKIVKATIKSDLMLHFIVEIFPADLLAAVALQRLFATIVKTEIEKALLKKDKASRVKFVRKGDDLYFGTQKLTISIASSSSVSSQIHFAINVTNSGTPVKTCALGDWKLNAKEISQACMKSFAAEFSDILFATQKVKPL